MPRIWDPITQSYSSPPPTTMTPLSARTTSSAPTPTQPPTRPTVPFSNLFNYASSMYNTQINSGRNPSLFFRTNPRGQTALYNDADQSITYSTLAQNPYGGGSSNALFRIDASGNNTRLLSGQANDAQQLWSRVKTPEQRASLAALIEQYSSTGMGGGQIAELLRSLAPGSSRSGSTPLLFNLPSQQPATSAWSRQFAQG